MYFNVFVCLPYVCDAFLLWFDFSLICLQRDLCDSHQVLLQIIWTVKSYSNESNNHPTEAWDSHTVWLTCKQHRHGWLPCLHHQSPDTLENVTPCAVRKQQQPNDRTAKKTWQIGLPANSTTVISLAKHWRVATRNTLVTLETVIPRASRKQQTARPEDRLTKKTTMWAEQKYKNQTGCQTGLAVWFSSC